MPHQLIERVGLHFGRKRWVFEQLRGGDRVGRIGNLHSVQQEPGRHRRNRVEISVSRYRGQQLVDIDCRNIGNRYRRVEQVRLIQQHVRQIGQRQVELLSDSGQAVRTLHRILERRHGYSYQRLQIHAGKIRGIEQRLKIGGLQASRVLQQQRGRD